jgi:hypothetical protein
MMREILFRGQAKDGRWVFGDLIQGEIDCPEWSGAVIIPFSVTANAVYVIPETVGEFTGFLDYNGTKIFEGDIVRTKCYESVAVVIYHQGAFEVNGLILAETYDASMGVIGNIHDNPELLKKKVTKLKPCRRCKCMPEVYDVKQYVYCAKCKITPDELYASEEEEAVTVWNKINEYII